MFDAKAFGEQMVSVVKEYVSKATTGLATRMDELELKLKSIPAGEKGERGEPGKDGHNGQNGIDGKNGQDGKSLTSEDIRPILELEVTRAVLDFERRSVDVLQKAIERMPVPKDGKDGLSLEDLTLDHDGDGGVIFRFQRGEVSKEFSLQLPRFKDCGVFKDGQMYKSGDGVSWAGSFFIAQCENPQGKPEESTDWRLAVKRGRDGKDAKAIDHSSPIVRTK